jgi:hypothetical protein
MTLSADDVAVLAATEEIEIETRAAAGAPVHRTIIWVVTDGSEAFIRSVLGTRARWYREAAAFPEVVIHAAGRTIPARVALATDPASVARASAALERKYPGDEGLPPMLLPETFETTLRLEPA